MHTSRMAVGNRVQYNVNGVDIYDQEGLDHNVLMDSLRSACASFGCWCVLGLWLSSPIKILSNQVSKLINQWPGQ